MLLRESRDNLAKKSVQSVLFSVKEIIARTDNPVLREICPEYRIRVLRTHETDSNAIALVLFHPTIWEMMEEERIAAEHGIVLVAVVEEFRHILYEALFPAAFILDDGDVLTPEILRNKSRKEIRFTEKEKRTLQELPYGLCSKELAVRLGVTERSVRRMKESLMRKTGLVSTSQLMIYALFLSRISNHSSSHSVDTV